jgi:hypothetical protein
MKVSDSTMKMEFESKDFISWRHFKCEGLERDGAVGTICNSCQKASLDQFIKASCKVIIFWDFERHYNRAGFVVLRDLDYFELTMFNARITSLKFTFTEFKDLGHRNFSTWTIY